MEDLFPVAIEVKDDKSTKVNSYKLNWKASQYGGSQQAESDIPTALGA